MTQTYAQTHAYTLDNVFHYTYTYTWILHCRYVVVEYGPEGKHLVCCEFCNEGTVMFEKISQTAGRVAAANGESTINTYTNNKQLSLL